MTVGQIVHYSESGVVYAAIITVVLGFGQVNLVVFDYNFTAAVRLASVPEGAGSGTWQQI